MVRLEDMRLKDGLEDGIVKDGFIRRVGNRIFMHKGVNMRQ